MSSNRTFIERALNGDVLDLSSIDDEIDAWHSSEAPGELHDWLGMTASEYALFVERPESLRLLLLARQHGQSLTDLLRTTDENGVALAARGASSTDVAGIRKWLETTGRL